MSTRRRATATPTWARSEDDRLSLAISRLTTVSTCRRDSSSGDRARFFEVVLDATRAGGGLETARRGAKRLAGVERARVGAERLARSETVGEDAGRRPEAEPVREAAENVPDVAGGPRSDTAPGTAENVPEF